MSKIRVHLFERYEIFEKVGSFEAEAFDQCRIEELDIRATTRVCDQDEMGRGIGFDDCKKLRKVIHNKNWRYLYWFQNSAEAEGLNVMWISV